MCLELTVQVSKKCVFPSFYLLSVASPLWGAWEAEGVTVQVYLQTVWVLPLFPKGWFQLDGQLSPHFSATVGDPGILLWF